MLGNGRTDGSICPGVLILLGTYETVYNKSKQTFRGMVCKTVSLVEKIELNV